MQYCTSECDVIFEVERGGGGCTGPGSRDFGGNHGYYVPCWPLGVRSSGGGKTTAYLEARVSQEDLYPGFVLCVGGGSGPHKRD